MLRVRLICRDGRLRGRRHLLPVHKLLLRMLVLMLKLVTIRQPLGLWLLLVVLVLDLLHVLVVQWLLGLLRRGVCLPHLCGGV